MIHADSDATVMIRPWPRATMARRAAVSPSSGGRAHHVEGALVLGRVSASSRRVGQAEAGVVDQHVDRTAGVGEAGGHAGHVGADGQVGDQHLDGDAVPRPQVGGGRLESLGVPRDQDEVVAAGRPAGGRTRRRCRRSRR